MPSPAPLTRTKSRVYIAVPKHKPSRFLIELIKDYNLPHPKDLNMKTVELFSLRCPVCRFPLKYEFNKNYGLPLYLCTNDPEVCDFMTNDKGAPNDIYKCPKCADGYMIVKQNSQDSTKIFYGCTNFSGEDKPCKNAAQFKL